MKRMASASCSIAPDSRRSETTDRRGVAELILAKQRNGPTGKVLVKFTSSCTRFDNLQPGDYDALMGQDDE